MTAPTTVDARGLLCPMPVIRVQDKARGLSSGSRLELLATDAGVHVDVPAWCRVHGHVVKACFEQDGEISMLIELGGALPGNNP